MPPHPISAPAIAGYQLDEVIGRGFSGTVWRGRRSTGEDVAVKVFDPARFPGQQRRRMSREARALAENPHPCLVPLLDADLEHDPPYLAFRYMEGGDFSGFIEPATLLPRAQVLAACARVADALVFLHSRGVVHRDLKPGNILRDARGQAYLGDLGLARSEGDPQLTTSGQVMGTWTYMAPEVQAGHPAVVQSDLYSLAAALVELLCGAPPVRSLRGIELPPEYAEIPLPDELRKQVRLALRTDPADRPRDVQGLARALEAAAAATL